MINITRSAVAQIKQAAKEYQGEDVYLRLAAQKQEDGGLEYAMGFDELREKDKTVTASGLEVLISESSVPLLKGATLDYVEIEGGEYQFAFVNPNDPNHSAPDGMEHLFEQDEPED